MKRNINDDDFEINGTKQSHRYYSLFLVKKAKGSSLTKLPVAANTKTRRASSKKSKGDFSIDEKYVNLGRTIGLLNVSLFKNPRTYIIGMLLPIVIAFLLQFLWTKYTFLEMTSPEMLSFMYVPVIAGAFYIGIMASETKQNKFQDKINIKVNNWNIVKYSMLILIVEITAINMVLTTMVFFIMAHAGWSVLDTVFKKLFFDNLMAFVWVYYVIFGLMLGLMSGLIFLLVQSLFNKKLFSLLAMSVALIFILFFSDTVIPSKVISNNNAMTVIGYFNPTKYVTWSMNLISSYQFEDPSGSSQIYIDKDGSFEPFNSLWQTTVPAIIFLAGLLLGYGFKKEEK